MKETINRKSSWLTYANLNKNLLNFVQTMISFTPWRDRKKLCINSDVIFESYFIFNNNTSALYLIMTFKLLLNQHKIE